MYKLLIMFVQKGVQTSSFKRSDQRAISVDRPTDPSRLALKPGHLNKNITPIKQDEDAHNVGVRKSKQGESCLWPRGVLLLDAKDISLLLLLFFQLVAI